jgi:hypothetical protein
LFAKRFEILHPEARYFHVHVPRTGGLSLFEWLSDIYGARNCCRYIEQFVWPIPESHAIAGLKKHRVVSGHVTIDSWEFFSDAGFLPITAIRNPVDQFFSRVNQILSSESRAFHSGGSYYELKSKLAVSVGGFLDDAQPHEWSFFESPQSKAVFGWKFPWRKLSVEDRVEWLRDTYAAVLTTETMGAQLTARVDYQLQNGMPFPRPTTSDHCRTGLTADQDYALQRLLAEDLALYRALAQPV